MTSMKIVQFLRIPILLSCYVQNSSTPLTMDAQLQTNSRPPPSLPLQMATSQLKGNIIQVLLLYVIRSFLQFGFCFQYQLINLVWLSIDFFPFSWSQPCPQSYFLKFKMSFSLSSYSEKMCWGQGWTATLLSAFLWLYILVCAIVQKYHEPFFIYNYSDF